MPVGLVTGANKGIGSEFARQLAQVGITVIIGARDPGRGGAAVKALADTPVNAIRCSRPQRSAEHRCGGRDDPRRQGWLDILVNNAGIVDAEDGPPTGGSPEAARRIMDPNFVGTLALTQAMLPLLRLSSAARIVSLSSSLGSLALNGDPASPYYSARLIGHNASKAALNMLTVQLAEELRDTPHVINSASPGYMKTDLTGHSGFMTAEESVRLPVEYALLGDDAVSGSFVEASGDAPGKLALIVRRLPS
jgi:NAD(P)-dependent dehydrogenase (short-subunit alcohol dehydrogenase family)